VVKVGDIIGIGVEKICGELMLDSSKFSLIQKKYNVTYCIYF
jgi:hypothetical protein